jgi:DNA-binding NarL/FixJ family response regulator
MPESPPESNELESRISVLIADDHALVRAGFRAILEGQPGISVCGEAEDGQRAIELARRRHPDVVLMDIQMPGIDGLEATRRLVQDQQREHPLAVLMLTTFDLDAYVYDALRAGASGFLLKDTPPEDLVAAIRVVARGDAMIAPGITKRLIEQFARSAPASTPPAALAELTPREAEVLVLVAHGLSNAEIAEKLVLSNATVKTHVARIFSKLDLHDRVQALCSRTRPASCFPAHRPRERRGELRYHLGMSEGSPALTTTPGRRAGSLDSVHDDPKEPCHDPPLGRPAPRPVRCERVAVPGRDRASGEPHSNAPLLRQARLDHAHPCRRHCRRPRSVSRAPARRHDGHRFARLRRHPQPPRQALDREHARALPIPQRRAGL